MRVALIAVLVLLCVPAAAVAAAGPEIHAHRGGSVTAGVPTFGEETMPAFRYAGEVERAVLELDVKLTSDRVPVVIHDDTLDRTSNCSGAVSSVTAAQFAACRVDVLGSGDCHRTGSGRHPYRHACRGAGLRAQLRSAG